MNTVRKAADSVQQQGYELQVANDVKQAVTDQ